MTQVLDVITSMTNNTEKMRADSPTGTSDLGPDAFLQLLMTQLKHQDPMEPMGNTEFLAQQAQFTNISELQKLNKIMSDSNQIMQASSLIGKTVSITNPNNPMETLEGKVTEAKINDKGASIVFENGKEYPLDNIVSIKNSEDI